jgi:hypothetical protein
MPYSSKTIQLKLYLMVKLYGVDVSIAGMKKPAQAGFLDYLLNQI